MNHFDRMDKLAVVSVVGKKRKPSKLHHNREVIKKMRHSGGGKMPAVTCTHTHTKNTNFCHADKLTPGDLLKNFHSFYCNVTKTDQDRAILQLTNVKNVKRRRLKVDDTDRQKARDITNQYSLLTEDHPKKIPVCKSTFCSVLGELNVLLYNN